MGTVPHYKVRDHQIVPECAENVDRSKTKITKGTEISIVRHKKIEIDTSLNYKFKL